MRGVLSARREKVLKETGAARVVPPEGREAGPGRVDDLIEREMIALLPRLRRFALGLTGRAEAADDLVQAACERAIRHIGQWDPGSRLDSWMYRIAHNLYRNGLRDRALAVRREEEAAAEAPLAEDGEAAALSRIELADLSAAMAHLPEEQRTALLLVAVEGRSYREIAEITGVPVATVNNRVARGRESLRRQLGRVPA